MGYQAKGDLVQILLMVNHKKKKKCFNLSNNLNAVLKKIEKNKKKARNTKKFSGEKISEFNLN